MTYIDSKMQAYLQIKSIRNLIKELPVINDGTLTLQLTLSSSTISEWNFRCSRRSQAAREPSSRPARTKDGFDGLNVAATGEDRQQRSCWGREGSCIDQRQTNPPSFSMASSTA